MKRFWRWIRFGHIREEIKGEVANVVSEIAYYGRGNKLVGYWAYGHFDPNLPYQGE